MTEENLTPVFETKPPSPAAPLGRRVDFLAALSAGFGAILSVIGAIWFFAGFAENDTRPEHLTSAVTLTLILFAFAVVPFGCTAQLARRAYRYGIKRSQFYWTLFLMLPWILLSSLAIFYTPLPIWCGIVFLVLASLLSFWAIISLVLERRNTVQTQ